MVGTTQMERSQQRVHQRAGKPDSEVYECKEQNVCQHVGHGGRIGEVGHNGTKHLVPKVRVTTMAITMASSDESCLTSPDMPPTIIPAATTAIIRKSIMLIIFVLCLLLGHCLGNRAHLQIFCKITANSTKCKAKNDTASTFSPLFAPRWADYRKISAIFASLWTYTT